MSRRCVQDGVFEWDTETPKLIGSTCGDCAHVTFPAQGACPACGRTNVARTPLSTRGTLWTFTRQRFQPKNPPYAGRESAKEFVPYAVGYIELPEGRVEARITGPADQELHIGMEMELTAAVFADEADGTELVTYAFRPVGS